MGEVGGVLQVPPLPWSCWFGDFGNKGQGPGCCPQQADSSLRTRSKPHFASLPPQTCPSCCRARCGAGFPLPHKTPSQPQRSSRATWQLSRQESSQLRSQEMTGWGDGHQPRGPRVPSSLWRHMWWQQLAMHFSGVPHPEQLPHSLTQQPPHPSSTSISSAPPQLQRCGSSCAERQKS